MKIPHCNLNPLLLGLSAIEITTDCPLPFQQGFLSLKTSIIPLPQIFSHVHETTPRQWFFSSKVMFSWLLIILLILLWVFFVSSMSFWNAAPEGHTILHMRPQQYRGKLKELLCTSQGLCLFHNSMADWLTLS